MGLVSRSLGVRAMSLEDPAQPLVPTSVMAETNRISAGVPVTERSAIGLPVAYSCVHILSEDLASLPLWIWQTLPDESVRKAIEHANYNLIAKTPNNRMTSMSWREAWIASALVYGSGYSYIVRDKGARPVRFVPLPSDQTGWAIYEDQLVYITTATKNGQPQAIAPENILHVPLMSFDGLSGISPIRNSMLAFGLGLAAERFGAHFFANGARATGVLTHPGVVDDEAYDRLKKSVREWVTGENALSPVLLEEGLKWEQISIPPEEAQFLQTRVHQDAQIAGMYRVPLHLLNQMQHATDNNIEHLSISYVRHGLRPLARRFELELDRKLLKPPFTTEHDLYDITRGDFVSQTEGMKNLRDTGAYSVNDIRRRLRDNPIPAEDGGDVRLAPLNMTSLALLAEPGGAPEPKSNEEDGSLASAADARRLRIASGFRPLIRDAVGRSIHRKASADWTAQALTPALTAMAEALLASSYASSLDDDDRGAVARVAAELATEASTWTRDAASDTATAIVAKAVDLLSQTLKV